MSTLHHYVSMIVFTLGFVLGIQVPNFMDQYAKRVDAHYLEATSHLQGYQKIADQNHGGRLDRLIEKHARSSDATFRDEAPVIQRLHTNQQRYLRERDAMSAGWLSRVRHLVVEGDREILLQTYHQYAAGVPFSTEAIVTGFGVALLLSAVLESLAGLLMLLFTRRRRHSLQ